MMVARATRAALACVVSAVVSTTFAPGPARGARPAPPAPRLPATPPPPFPSLPVIASVRLDVGADYVVVTEDVLISRGDHVSGDLPLYVALGAPSMPRAFDAFLFAANPAAFEIAPAGREPIVVERLPRRPSGARLLLGRAQMTGAVLHVREPAFRRATAPSGAAIVRLRQVLDAAPELVVRLGAEGSTPLTLLRIEAHAEPGVTLERVTASLCGKDADTYPLAVTWPGRTPPRDASLGPLPIPPAFAVRRETDDLCVRYALAKPR